MTDVHETVKNENKVEFSEKSEWSLKTNGIR